MSVICSCLQCCHFGQFLRI